jgi:hypothetical protein
MILAGHFQTILYSFLALGLFAAALARISHGLLAKAVLPWHN